MRISLVLSLVALGALLGGATLAQDAAPSPAPTPAADPVQADAPTDPFLRALGGTAGAPPTADPVGPVPRATIQAVTGSSGRTLIGLGIPGGAQEAPTADASPLDGVDAQDGWFFSNTGGVQAPMVSDGFSGRSAKKPSVYQYVVQEGDSLTRIAQQFNSTVDQLRAMNPEVAVNQLAVGTQLRIPVQVAGRGDGGQQNPAATWLEADRIAFDGLPGGRYAVTADGGVRIWNDPRLPGAVRWATPNDSGSVALRVTVEGGRVQVWQEGRAIPDDRVEREGNTFVIHDGEGRTLASIDVDTDGRVTIPSGWTFRGPAQWTTERLSRNVIGIRTGGVEAALARHLRLEEGHGILVTEVVPGHPAERAGLRGYDVIVAVDGKGPATLDFLKQILASKDTNSTVTLTVVRAGNTLEIRSGITTVSAPVGRTMTSPEGAFALGSLGVDAAGVESAPSLIWRRGGVPGSVVDPRGNVVRGGLVGPGATASGGRVRRNTGIGLPDAAGAIGVEVPSDPLSGADVPRTGIIGRLVDDAQLAPPLALDEAASLSIEEMRDRLPADWQVRYRLNEEMQKNAESEKRLMEMEEQLHRLEALLQKFLEESKPTDPETGRVAPSIDCKVIAAKEGTAVLSVGRDDGVQVGDEFTVYRGDQFVGKVRVTNIADETAAATVIFTSDTTKVQTADHATNRLSFEFSEPRGQRNW